MSEQVSAAPSVSLRLYIVAGAPNSTAAQRNLEAILTDLGAGHFALEIVDCVIEPLRALAEGVVVTPTLVKVSPAPTRTIIGTLSDRASVAAVLALDAPQPLASR